MNKKILSLLMVLLCGFTFAACGKDETWIRPQHNTPLRPDNGKSETPHEDEDAPAKVQLTLAGGHFHGVAFHQDADAKGMLYKKAVQHITYVREGNQWKLAEGSDSVFRVMSSNEYRILRFVDQILRQGWQRHHKHHRRKWRKQSASALLPSQQCAPHFRWQSSRI